ncbi:WD domain, G-beta repeat, putative [Angomonas deanei]|uniref:WD domain, G-beta repeat, putative n=1 Tax=Angomonas deanei TaxID=59799 RepID=A0A7G2CJ07_9TRYP|nr:WD domain, G-beta repeat, putative [Angomonas deanei]
MTSTALKLSNVLCASPTAVRGAPVRLDGHKNSIAYSSGSCVIVKSLAEGKSCALVCNLHKATVTAVRFSPDGSLVASGDQDGGVVVWENKEGCKEKLNTRVLQGAVRDIAFSGDGKTVVVCGEGKTTFGVMFTVDGVPCGAVQGHTRKLMSVDIRYAPPLQMATGGGECSVSFHEKNPITLCSNSNPGHENTITFVRYSADGKELVTSSSSPKLFIFDTATQKSTRHIDTKHTGTTYAFGWSSDNTQIATCSADKTVRILDYNTGNLLHTVNMGKDVSEMQQGIASVEEGFVSASLGGSLRLIKGGQVSKTFIGHQARVLFLHVNQENKLFSLSVDGRLLSWEKGGETGSAVLINTVSDVANAAAVLNDVIYIAAGKQIISYDTTAQDGAVTVVSKDVNFPSAIAVTSEKAIVALYRSKAAIVDTKTEVPLARFEGTCADCHGTTVVFGGDNEAKLFDIKGGVITPLINIPHTASVSAVNFSKDGSRLVTGESSRNITVWDAKTGASLFSQLTFHTLSVTKVCFDATGKRLLSGSSDSSVIVWDLDGNSRRIQDNAHKSGVSSVLWGPKGELVSCGGDFCVKLWN